MSWLSNNLSEAIKKQMASRSQENIAGKYYFFIIVY